MDGWRRERNLETLFMAVTGAQVHKNASKDSPFLSFALSTTLVALSHRVKMRYRLCKAFL